MVPQIENLCVRTGSILPPGGEPRRAEHGDDATPQSVAARLDLDDHHVASAPGSRGGEVAQFIQLLSQSDSGIEP